MNEQEEGGREEGDGERREEGAPENDFARAIAVLDCYTPSCSRSDYRAMQYRTVVHYYTTVLLVARELACKLIRVAEKELIRTKMKAFSINDDTK